MNRTEPVSTPQPVSIIGLGPMGQALASAFIKGGHPTTVWNRTTSKADALVAQGANHATTIADAIAASPLVITSLMDNDTVRTVLNPVTEMLTERGLINLTSSAPEQARQTAV